MSYSWMDECEVDQSDVVDFAASHQDIQDIYVDYKLQRNELEYTASSIAARLQKFDGVHSVRWRTKSPSHLVRKIIRKKKISNDKYADINRDNYTVKITDLVGIRVLHLFKSDLAIIHEQIMETWDPVEKIVYTRSGDAPELVEAYRKLELAVQEHNDGYRSVHYIFDTQMTKRKIPVELQVRTIFEEGWSEIDHALRYPNFTEDLLISGFLATFNRLSGAADEMGTFVKLLSENLGEYRSQVASAKQAETELAEMVSQKIGELSSFTDENVDLRLKIGELQKLNKEQKESAERAKNANIDWTKAILTTPREIDFPSKAVNNAISAMDFIKRGQ